MKRFLTLSALLVMTGLVLPAPEARADGFIVVDPEHWRPPPHPIPPPWPPPYPWPPRPVLQFVLDGTVYEIYE